MGRQRWETRTARVGYLSRSGLTVGEVREFLRQVDDEEIPDDTPVRLNRHVGEGSVSGHIEASVRMPLEDDGGRVR